MLQSSNLQLQLPVTFLFDSHDSTNVNIFQVITGSSLHEIIYYCYEKQIFVSYESKNVFLLLATKFYVLTDCDKNKLILWGRYL